jgi:hypothetical protein
VRRRIDWGMGSSGSEGVARPLGASPKDRTVSPSNAGPSGDCRLERLGLQRAGDTRMIHAGAGGRVSIYRMWQLANPCFSRYRWWYSSAR